jgi:GGDEF domain-containing protein
VAWLDGQPRTQLFASSGIMVAALAGLSSAIGSELALVVFYLAPISIAAYFVGRWQGRLVALLSAFTWTTMEQALRPGEMPLPAVFAAGFNRAVLFLVVAELFAALREAFNHESQLARTDELTGLSNSRAFSERAEQELLRARRYGRALSLLYIDLDGFKTINDSLGHAAGDVVLQRTANALRESLRRTDVIARLGGDEFVVLLPETGTESTDIVIGKVQDSLGRALQGLGSGTTGEHRRGDRGRGTDHRADAAGAGRPADLCVEGQGQEPGHPRYRHQLGRVAGRMSRTGRIRSVGHRAQWSPGDTMRLVIHGAAALILGSFSSSLLAQRAATPPGSDTANKITSATLSGLRFRTLGPALTSGRIVDIAIHPANKGTWYIAAASGGVWKTANAGTTWTPIFDEQGSYSIGALAIDPKDPLTVWVGTGENNSQRSVGYGDGVYKSTDGGRTWTNTGLKLSGNIGRIAIDPRNSAVVYVAAQGPLWSGGGERGVYKTTDGWCNLDPGAQGGQRLDRRQRGAPRSAQPGCRVCRDVAAVPAAVGIHRRGPGIRHPEVDRRRQDLEEAHHRPADGGDGEDRSRGRHRPIRPPCTRSSRPRTAAVASSARPTPARAGGR